MERPPSPSLHIEISLPGIYSNFYVQEMSLVFLQIFSRSKQVIFSADQVVVNRRKSFEEQATRPLSEGIVFNAYALVHMVLVPGTR